MGYVIIRFILILSCVLFGYGLAGQVHLDAYPPHIGAIIGFFIGIFIVAVELGVARAKTKALIAGILGIILGLIITNLVIHTFPFLYGNSFLVTTIRPVVAVFLCYLGVMLIIRKKDEISFSAPFFKWAGETEGNRFKILDTSVIIDGRIAEICETGFVGGILIVPRFVLHETQAIADSSDSLRRNRGRKGLDILRKLQKSKFVKVVIQDVDFPELHTVDAKLLRFAKSLDAQIFTNDYNLNKVAVLENIKILNINELANALKSVVLPGEKMEVKVVKAGKEFNQGVAYLDDGTMIVIEEGKSRLGQTVEVVVTSVLQTSAGRMIFGRFHNGRRKA